MNTRPLHIASLSRAAYCGLLLAIGTGASLFADLASGQTTNAQPANRPTTAEKVVYEISRLRSYDDERLPMALMAAAAIALVAVVWYFYRRDALELAAPARWSVTLLRCLALAGLFVFFLGIERRTTTEVVHNSQVTVLVDVSQSMGLSATDQPTESGADRRIQQVIDALAQSPLIERLRETHDVSVARFDEDLEPIVTMPKSRESRDEGREPEADAKTSPPLESRNSKLASIDWSTELQPRGTETRLGQALAEQLTKYRNSPLAAIVVITDGAQNAGMEPSAAVEAAKAAKVPLYAIGVGSVESPRNVAIRDLVAPTRAFPGDTLNITAYIQASGFANRPVDVELNRRSADGPAGSGAPVATRTVPLAEDDGMIPVSFDVEPGEAGTFVYQVRLKAPADDGNSRDNEREAEVQVVDRKTKVLLIASGPMRDYQYLRNQLYRDKTMTVDVLLQTAQPGISQEANKILDQFPTTAEELFQYDCIVAFDPDWTELDAQQVELLDKWISEEAGGMIAVAGPIQTPHWVRSTEQAKLRDLYPVVFQQRMTLLDDGQYGGETPWPLALERAGREAKFLWLEKTAEESESAWENFPGVYGYYAVKGEKPGATVYARFSDPEAGGKQRPVYFASQFYGAGQVFYIGSGEMWRLRSLDPKYLEVLYTKLIRHVSQGRILRGSARGALLVERDRYELGETVVLRARLADAQHNALTDESVTGQVLRPDGSTEPIKLTAEVEKPGMYVGQMSVLQEGTYQIALPLPGGGDEPLSRYLQVRVPDLERTHAERNEPLLASLATETGGQYYKEFSAAIRGDAQTKPLDQLIENRAEIKLVKGAPDKYFARKQMQGLLIVIAGALFFEWIIRRLNRLA